MKLFIMRHGPAEDQSASGLDADRALTSAGRDRARNVGRLLLEEGEAPLTIVSSPLVRSLQTAEIVAAICHPTGTANGPTKTGAPNGTLIEFSVRRELAPAGNALSLVRALLQVRARRVLFVGHEPDVSILATSLLGDAAGSTFRALGAVTSGFMKAMVVGLHLAEDEVPESRAMQELRARPRFILDPKKLALVRLS